MSKYTLSYDIEYSDGSKGHGSHGDYTHEEAVKAKEAMQHRKYTPEELEHAPMYFNFSIDEVEDNTCSVCGGWLMDDCCPSCDTK